MQLLPVNVMIATFAAKATRLFEPTISVGASAAVWKIVKSFPDHFLLLVIGNMMSNLRKYGVVRMQFLPGDVMTTASAAIATFLLNPSIPFGAFSLSWKIVECFLDLSLRFLVRDHSCLGCFVLRVQLLPSNVVAAT